MDKKKIIYIGSLLILTVIVSITYFSYAFFTNRNEQHGKLNIVTGTLDYKIESDDLNNNQITLDAGELKNIKIKLTSLNDIESKYELYYETNNNVKVGYIGTIPKGTINKKEIKIFNIGIKNYSTAKTTVTFKVDGGFVNNELVKGNGTSIPIVSSLCTYTKNQVFNFTYTGNPQAFDTDFCSGAYKMDLWGSSGIYNDFLLTDSYGRGAYTSGNINLLYLNKLFIYVGGAPGFNGAGDGEARGGGATDIRLVGGSWNSFDSLKSRIMVAAGGGGGMYNLHMTLIQRGDAGGLNGYDAVGDAGANWNNRKDLGGHGATQTAGGIGGQSINTYDPYMDQGNGSFGVAGYTGPSSGGGSGYYGGGHGYHPGGTWTGGGGGSSFISGYSGCNAISESSTLSNIIHTGQPNHYSGYVFTNGVMIDGNGCNWSTGSAANCGANQPQPNGTNAVGHSGNGYARITYLGE